MKRILDLKQIPNLRCSTAVLFCTCLQCNQSQVQGFGTCCGYPVQGFETDGASAPNPASGGNGISSSGWLFSVCENGNCPALDKYAPDYGISTWFQQLWKVLPRPRTKQALHLTDACAFYGHQEASFLELATIFKKLLLSFISSGQTRLLQDPAWVQACATRYAALRAGPWSNNSLANELQVMQQQLGEAAVRTLTRQVACK